MRDLTKLAVKFGYIVVECLTNYFAIVTDDHCDPTERERAAGSWQARQIPRMDACCYPLGSHLVPMHHTVRHRDLSIGRSRGNHVFSSHYGCAANEGLRVHTVLDDGMLSVIVVQCGYIASRLVSEVIVMALQVLCWIFKMSAWIPWPGLGRFKRAFSQGPCFFINTLKALA